MTSSQSFKIYEILQRYFDNESDAKEIVQEIESAIEHKIESKKDIFLTKDDKIDLIKWMVGFWLTQMAAIIGLYASR